jgi:hypothetical protein
MKCPFGASSPISKRLEAADLRAAAQRSTMSRDDMSSSPIIMTHQGDGIIGRSKGEDMYTARRTHSIFKFPTSY